MTPRNPCKAILGESLDLLEAATVKLLENKRAACIAGPRLPGILLQIRRTRAKIGPPPPAVPRRPYCE